ncbi:homeobox-like protein HDP1 [Danio aesculapii]|uniref:homeobox-like protein HDP1 n=1 Tax=Danio aesculapii TaxID=1142201 RepID=UPI0024BF3AD9|nr:homeobox-like protein HDP1 [Danio aesculapii]
MMGEELCEQRQEWAWPAEQERKRGANNCSPQIFYPFGSAAGDSINPAIDDGSSSVITLLSSFPFFGRTYQQIYVNNNGDLTFSQAFSRYVPYSFPANGSQDIIAGLWTDLNNGASGVISYHQYTSGSVLTRATQDINTYFPNLPFTASWVFVATWDKVPYHLSTAETSFQVVLISGSNYSFILMNYGNIAATGRSVEAGYDTVNSTNYFVIPESNNGSSVSNLNASSNINVPGQWVFRVDGGPQTGSGIFYPFGSAAGDSINPAADDGSSSDITLLSSFLFFGRTYQKIYVNNNGDLTFSQAFSQFVPYSFPAYGSQDIIAGLWTDLNNGASGVISYHQYTNGSVLTRATQDINTYFPNLPFTASWVFVATWDKVPYLSSTETSFQVVLISGSNYSFILMNYGNIAATGRSVEAGYDTISSTNYFVIPESNSGSSVSNLNTSSNINVPGRWIFRVDGGPQTGFVFFNSNNNYCNTYNNNYNNNNNTYYHNYYNTNNNNYNNTYYHNYYNTYNNNNNTYYHNYYNTYNNNNNNNTYYHNYYNTYNNNNNTYYHNYYNTYNNNNNNNTYYHNYYNTYNNNNNTYYHNYYNTYNNNNNNNTYYHNYYNTYNNKYYNNIYYNNSSTFNISDNNNARNYNYCNNYGSKYYNNTYYNNNFSTYNSKYYNTYHNNNYSTYNSKYYTNTYYNYYYSTYNKKYYNTYYNKYYSTYNKKYYNTYYNKYYSTFNKKYYNTYYNKYYSTYNSKYYNNTYYNNNYITYNSKYYNTYYNNNYSTYHSKYYNTCYNYYYSTYHRKYYNTYYNNYYSTYNNNYNTYNNNYNAYYNIFSNFNISDNNNAR